MTPSTILRVAVDVPLSRLFDYLPPADAPPPPVGARVLVPFGRRRLTGLVVEHAAHSELPAAKLKRASAGLDDDALLSADDLSLLSFASDYYHHPLGEVVAAALPLALRTGRPLYGASERLALAGGQEADLNTLARRAPRQAALLSLLNEHAPRAVDTDALKQTHPGLAAPRRGAA